MISLDFLDHSDIPCFHGILAIPWYRFLISLNINCIPDIHVIPNFPSYSLISLKSLISMISLIPLTSLDILHNPDIPDISSQHSLYPWYFVISLDIPWYPYCSWYYLMSLILQKCIIVTHLLWKISEFLDNMVICHKKLKELEKKSI